MSNYKHGEAYIYNATTQTFDPVLKRKHWSIVNEMIKVAAEEAREDAAKTTKALRAELKACRDFGDELYSAFVSVEMPTPGQREALDVWAAFSNNNKGVR